MSVLQQPGAEGVLCRFHSLCSSQRHALELLCQHGAFVSVRRMKLCCRVRPSLTNPCCFFSLVFLLLACFFADHFYIAGQMYRVHSAADQLVNAVVLSFWGAAIENHLGPTTLVCFSDCRQEENTYILSLLTSTSSERLLICQVAFGWSQRTQVYIHKTCECPCALLMYYRQTAKWAESLLKFMWPVNHFHCIDVYIQTYKHTYIHTCIHTHMRKNFDSSGQTYIHTYILAVQF